LLLLDPPGALNVSSRSGIPDIFAVNAIEPDETAEMGLPEGARVTEIFSRISTYSSFEVWRTFGRLHGIAGPLFRFEPAFRLAARLLAGPRAGEALRHHIISIRRNSRSIVGDLP
jgi:hypothetical protein